MKTKVTLLATTTLAVLIAAAPAEAKGSGWYLNISGGANWLNDDSFSGTVAPDALSVTPDSDTGFIVSGAIGMSLASVLDGLRVEAEVAYRQNKVDGTWASDTNTTAVGGNAVGRLDYDHSTLSVMANVWYDFDIGGVKPYVGGGIGWADTDLDGNYIATTPVAVRPLSFSDSGFAWQLGAGANFAISPNMSLGVGYRYFRGPDVTVGGSVAANGVTGDLESQNHAAVVSLTFGM